MVSSNNASKQQMGFNSGFKGLSIAGLSVRLFVGYAFRGILQFSKGRLLCEIC